MKLNKKRIESAALADEFKKELERRYTAYKDGSEKGVTAEESKKRIAEILKSARK